MKSVTEKMKGESQGWAGLKDIVRGTIAVDNLSQIACLKAKIMGCLVQLKVVYMAQAAVVVAAE